MRTGTFSSLFHSLSLARATDTCSRIPNQAPIFLQIQLSLVHLKTSLERLNSYSGKSQNKVSDSTVFCLLGIIDLFSTPPNSDWVPVLALGTLQGAEGRMRLAKRALLLQFKLRVKGVSSQPACCANKRRRNPERTLPQSLHGGIVNTSCKSRFSSPSAVVQYLMK